MNRPLRSARDLAEAGLVPAEQLGAIERVAARYAVSVTPGLAALVDASDAEDPIARQFVPAPEELATRPEEMADPIGDLVHSPVPGIVHRYPDRVLLKPVHVCAVYCRFCFRREVVGPGKDEALSAADLAGAIAYIRDHPAIWEVILSGGDPLVMAPRRLAALFADLTPIEHVRVIRIHTRVPVADPGRITAELVAALRDAKQPVWVVLHANHARELTPDVRAACGRLVEAGIPLLSQSVLLRGVNDRPDTIETLLRALVETRIKPYYLHQGDLAPGTAHFRTSIDEGQRLLRDLRGRVSGLCQPTYVLDIPGGHGKVPVGPTYLGTDDVADWRGARHPRSDRP